MSLNFNVKEQRNPDPACASRSSAHGNSEEIQKSYLFETEISLGGETNQRSGTN